jgi:hypothetical protein
MDLSTISYDFLAKPSWQLIALYQMCLSMFEWAKQPDPGLIIDPRL